MNFLRKVSLTLNPRDQGGSVRKTGPGTMRMASTYRQSFLAGNRLEEGTWILAASGAWGEKNALTLAGGTLDVTLPRSATLSATDLTADQLRQIRINGYRARRSEDGKLVASVGLVVIFR